VQYSTGYGATDVVRDVDLRVERGSVVALVGVNGAGKTTTLLGICGLLPAKRGEVRFDGRQTRAPFHRRARMGLGYIPSAHAIFREQTVLENLRTSRVRPEEVFGLFPELERRAQTRAGLLSGGEQQMLAVGRTLARPPDFLVVDELSLGLAPTITTRLLRKVSDAAKEGIGILLVEQQVHKVLQHADYAYLMHRGRIAREGLPRP
jgi:branched-chain amino acid transport system ATP-binding protein